MFKSKIIIAKLEFDCLFNHAQFIKLITIFNKFFKYKSVVLNFCDCIWLLLLLLHIAYNK